MLGTGTEVHDRRTTRFVTGGLLVVMALAISGLGSPPAAAQDAPPPAPEAEEGEPVEIEASTLYVSPLTDALPPTLTKSVPPAAVCVLQPDFCPESAEPLRNAITGAIAEVQDNAMDLPVQPVPADSAAVSVFAGAERYQTAILFQPPAIPEGEDVMRYELSFPQSQPTYDFGSPAFRRVVLGFFEFLADRDRDPTIIFNGIVAALEEDPIDTSKVIGVEACPLLEAFEPGGAPMASQSDELPQQEFDGDMVAAVDCTFGGNGVYDPDQEIWKIDLAFTAQAWSDGELENNGVLLRPIGVPNLAFGDADTSTSAQIVLDLAEVTAVVETAEAFDPDAFGDFPDADFPADEDGFEEGFEGGEFEGDAPSFDDGGSDLGTPLGAPEFPSDLDDAGFEADAPAVADGLEAGEGDPEVALDAQAARPAGSTPLTPWWVWLVAPLLLGGAYLTGSAVMAPAPVVAAGGGGALTRMLEKHAPASSMPTQI